MSGVRIISAHLYEVRIPLKGSFRHSTMSRKYAESLIVKLIAEDGEVGFGEGAPRHYVTGETLGSSAQFLGRGLSIGLKKGLCAECSSGVISQLVPSEVARLMSSVKQVCLVQETPPGIVAWNAAFAAFELALIDLILRSLKSSAEEILPALREHVEYSGVVGTEGIEQVEKIAMRCKSAQLRNIKVKVGQGDDIERLALVRDIVGREVSLRVDANGAFTTSQALKFIERAHAFGIESIEQPVKRTDWAGMSEVTKHSAVSVLADESLVTFDDGERLIDQKGCRAFNLRVSKNGGIAGVLALSKLAKEAGLGIQLGCQVGETSILSAAGRHLAMSLPELCYVEGSYGTMLLEEDIAEPVLMFGVEGRAEAIGGRGWGVTIDEQDLQKWSTNTIDIKG